MEGKLNKEMINSECLEAKDGVTQSDPVLIPLAFFVKIILV